MNYADIYINWYGMCAPFVYNKWVRKCKRRLRCALVKITNAVYKSSLPHRIDLSLLEKNGAKLYTTQPQMLTLAKSHLKLIFFKSGKFRLMGGGFHPTWWNAHVQLQKFFPLLPHYNWVEMLQTRLSNNHCYIYIISFN